MRRIATAALLAGLLAPSPARAELTSSRSGLYLGAGGGSGNSGLPFAGGGGWYGNIGVWIGRYDEDMALGRHWGFAATVRQDFIPSTGLLTTAPMLEIRRGFDLLVVGFSGFVEGGPLLGTDSGTTTLTGGTLRVGGNVKWRFHAHWGLNLRIDAGADLFGGPATGDPVQVGGTLGVTLGLEFTEIFKKKSDSE